MKVASVIVTNNRLELLKEALSAVKHQSYAVDKIIVVNNGSTDATDVWLNEQQGLVVIHQENSGGSGGFYTGIKAAVESGAGWICIMYDDTVCRENTLEILVGKLFEINNNKVGFIGSKCIWKD